MNARKLGFLSLTAALSLSTAAFAAQDPALVGDATILPKSHALNQSEIMAGTMAANKACAADVKDFGTMLVNDHKANDANVQTLATGEQLDLAAVNWTPAENQEVQKLNDGMNDLAKITDCSFDKAFLSAMVESHQFAVDVLNDALTINSTPGVQNYVRATLPVVQQHLDEANDLLKNAK